MGFPRHSEFIKGPDRFRLDQITLEGPVKDNIVDHLIAPEVTGLPEMAQNRRARQPPQGLGRSLLRGADTLLAAELTGADAGETVEGFREMHDVAKTALQRHLMRFELGS